MGRRWNGRVVGRFHPKLILTATAVKGIRPSTGQPSKPSLTRVVIGHERYLAELSAELEEIS